MKKLPEEFKPKEGVSCPECRMRGAGEIGRVYQAGTHEEGWEQVTLFGCDVCEAVFETRKNKGLLEVLLPNVEVTAVRQRQPWTYVEVEFDWFDVVETDETICYYDFGFSKVCVPDEWDEDKGVDVAVRHAIQHAIVEHGLRLPVR